MNRPLLILLIAAALRPVGFAAGSIDPAFPPTNVGFGILKIALQSDSRILVAGTTHFDATASPTNILRLRTDGTIDETFPSTRLGGTELFPGFTNPPSINALVVLQDDKMLVGGSFGSVNGTLRTNLARLNADGSMDTTFNAGFSDTVLSVLPIAGGKMLVGGNFKKYGAVDRKYIARINADGSLDTSFSPDWPSPYLGGPINGITVQADGKILAAGGITTFDGGVGVVSLVRLNTDGKLDTTFKPPRLAALTQSGQSTILLPDGSIVLSGLFPSLNGIARSDIARLSGDGMVDPAWGGAGSQGNSLADHVKGMLQQADGKIVIGGTFGKFSDVNKKGFVRLNTDGTIDPDFNYTDGSTTLVGTMALQKDGNLLVGGTFTLGSSTFTLMRLLAGGGTAAPVISTPPLSQTVNAGATIELSVIATGGTLTYQWFKDGNAINGETHPSLTLFDIKPEQSGNYYVVVSNGKSIQSQPAVVVVNSAPVITTQPVAQTVEAGGTAKFSVIAAGTTPLGYQWQFNGSPLANEASSTLTLNNVRPAQAGKYRVVVHNAIGEAPSTEVALTVTVAPPKITKHPLGQTVTATANVTLPTCNNLSPANVLGAIFTMTVLDGAAPFANSGSYKVTLDKANYHLTANGINPARDGAWSFGPDLDISTVLTVQNYFGDARITHWALLANCEYELYGDNMVSSQHGTYTVSGGSSSVAQTVTFTVEASGLAPLTYEWRKNGASIPNAVGPTLIIPATIDSAGTYTVLVSNSGGSTLSDSAVLTINYGAVPAVQFTASAQGLSVRFPNGYTLQGTTSLASPAWSAAGTTSPQTFRYDGRQRYFRAVPSPGQ